jgi:hypothetical protein
MSTLIRTVSPMDNRSDQIKQPGMKRTCARLPGRLKTNIVTLR